MSKLYDYISYLFDFICDGNDQLHKLEIAFICDYYNLTKCLMSSNAGKDPSGFR